MLLLNSVIILTSNYSKNCKSLYQGMVILTHYPEQRGCELDTEQVAGHTLTP